MIRVKIESSSIYVKVSARGTSQEERHEKMTQQKYENGIKRQTKEKKKDNKIYKTKKKKDKKNTKEK